MSVGSNYQGSLDIRQHLEGMIFCTCRFRKGKGNVRTARNIFSFKMKSDNSEYSDGRKYVAKNNYCASYSLYINDQTGFLRAFMLCIFPRAC